MAGFRKPDADDWADGDPKLLTYNAADWTTKHAWHRARVDAMRRAGAPHQLEALQLVAELINYADTHCGDGPINPEGNKS